MFHTNLKSRRLFCGLSQQQVADHLCVTPQSISKWENGSALPSIEYLPKLAELLDCEINTFFADGQSSNEDLTMLNNFFAVMTEVIYKETKNMDAAMFFIQEHPSIMEIFPEFCNRLNQHQTISCKMLQSILSCSENETLEFIDHLENCEMIEKLEGTNLYFVAHEAGNGLLTILKLYNYMLKEGFLEKIKVREHSSF